MTDLLPCPFCGGEAERLDFEGDDPNAGGSCISCKRCEACSPVHFDRKENLYSSWNDRCRAPAQGCRDAVVEECAAVCDKHAAWSEQKIERNPSSTASQIFATISNTANDLAEMIRDLKASASTERQP